MQSLINQHKQQRVKSCTVVLSLLQNDHEMLESALCSDEYSFIWKLKLTELSLLSRGKSRLPSLSTLVLIQS